MLKLLSTLVRGAVADADEALFDANATRILAQQLREAAQALELSKRELSCAMAHRASEARAAAALEARIAGLEQGAVEAIEGAHDALAADAAAVIAANEDELADRRAAIADCDREIASLRRLAEEGERRLQEVRRGLELARAREALRRAGANGRRAIESGSGALSEAETTLSRIRELHARASDQVAARAELDRDTAGRNIEQRLAAAGFGPDVRTRPADVLTRLQARAAARTAPASVSPASQPSSP